MVVGRGRRWLSSRVLWAGFASAVALIPFLRGLTDSRVFYLRDLSLHFWYAYLWLRRTLWSGQSPFWDPYLGGGQSAVADGMHQIFLLPTLAIRFIGGEVLGFNLWVLMPFPLAALGAWLFFSRRYSAPAASLGAIAFAVSGPIVATGNFPNMSWSVAAFGWVLWAADRVMGEVRPRRVAVLALAVAFQALAGEPVTMLATLVVTAMFVVVVSPREPLNVADAKPLLAVGAGVALGLLLSAVQLLPMQHAASISPRAMATSGVADFWSLHPLMLVETVAPNLMGDYMSTLTLPSLPWMQLLNSGRDKFFFSLYLGAPLLALAAFGLSSRRERRWSLFWIACGAAGLVCAFGGYTPIYPFFRHHLPLLGSFRFPVKYLVVPSMSLAAGAAAGWDLLPIGGGSRRFASAAVLAIGVVAYVAAGLCIYFPNTAARAFYDLARALPAPQTIAKMPAPDPVDAAAFMLHALPHAATTVLLIALAAGGLLWIGAGDRKEAPIARRLLYAFIVCDLVVRAWPVNPVFDPVYLAEPEWLSYTRADPDARFYIGGKRLGFLDTADPDGSRAFVGRGDLDGAESRAALSSEAVFYPSPWHAREMLSHDLPVLWPKEFGLADDRFTKSNQKARDLFLRRTGVRYRILAERAAAGHAPLVKLPYFYESSLYDWGPSTPRVFVAAASKVEADTDAQIRMLFEDGWDNRQTAIVDRDVPAAGAAGAATGPAANITAASTTQLMVNADIASGGGYLVVLDSYSPDWRVVVDGVQAPLLRADALFRAVHLTAGRHTVEFRYAPPALLLGAAMSALALIACLGLLVWPTR
jgi:hypothetical protein